MKIEYSIICGKKNISIILRRDCAARVEILNEKYYVRWLVFRDVFRGGRRTVEVEISLGPLIAE